jgi:hypothetical protein
MRRFVSLRIRNFESGKLKVNDMISVVYDPERPKRNRPYPFSRVTLDREW